MGWFGVEFHDAALFGPAAFALLQQALQVRTIFMLFSDQACGRIHQAAGYADLLHVFIQLFLARLQEALIFFLFLLDLFFCLLLLLVSPQLKPALGD